MDIEEMRINLKESGVKQAMNMKEETILKKFNDLQLESPVAEWVEIFEDLKVDTTEDNRKFLSKCGFNFDSLKR